MIQRMIDFVLWRCWFPFIDRCVVYWLQWRRGVKSFAYRGQYCWIGSAVDNKWREVAGIMAASEFAARRMAISLLRVGENCESDEV